MLKVRLTFPIHERKSALVPIAEEWLASGEAEDFNEDGFVDEADYARVSWNMRMEVLKVLVPMCHLLKSGWIVVEPRTLTRTVS